MSKEKVLSFPTSDTEITLEEDMVFALYKCRLELAQAINRSHANKVPFTEEGCKALETYNRHAATYGQPLLDYTPPEV